MGEQADLILNGDVCEGCGENFDDEGDGFPRRCSSCSNSNKQRLSNPIKKEKMDEAWRLFKAAGFCWDSFNNGLHWKIAGIDFYPTTHRWMDVKKDFRGEGCKEFIDYIRSHKHKPIKPSNVLTVDQLFEIAKRCKDKSLYSICEAIHKEVYK